MWSGGGVIVIKIVNYLTNYVLMYIILEYFIYYFNNMASSAATLNDNAWHRVSDNLEWRSSSHSNNVKNKAKNDLHDSFVEWLFTYTPSSDNKEPLKEHFYFNKVKEYEFPIIGEFPWAKPKESSLFVSVTKEIIKDDKNDKEIVWTSLEEIRMTKSLDDLSDHVNQWIQKIKELEATKDFPEIGKIMMWFEADINTLESGVYISWFVDAFDVDPINRIVNDTSTINWLSGCRSIKEVNQNIKEKSKDCLKNFYSPLISLDKSEEFYYKLSQLLFFHGIKYRLKKLSIAEDISQERNKETIEKEKEVVMRKINSLKKIPSEKRIDEDFVKFEELEKLRLNLNAELEKFDNQWDVKIVKQTDNDTILTKEKIEDDFFAKEIADMLDKEKLDSVEKDIKNMRREDADILKWIPSDEINEDDNEIVDLNYGVEETIEDDELEIFDRGLNERPPILNPRRLIPQSGSKTEYDPINPSKRLQEVIDSEAAKVEAADLAKVKEEEKAAKEIQIQALQSQFNLFDINDKKNYIIDKDVLKTINIWIILVLNNDDGVQGFYKVIEKNRLSWSSWIEIMIENVKDWKKSKINKKSFESNKKDLRKPKYYHLPDGNIVIHDIAVQTFNVEAAAKEAADKEAKEERGKVQERINIDLSEIRWLASLAKFNNLTSFVKKLQQLVIDKDTIKEVLKNNKHMKGLTSDIKWTKSFIEANKEAIQVEANKEAIQEKVSEEDINILISAFEKFLDSQETTAPKRYLVENLDKSIDEVWVCVEDMELFDTLVKAKEVTEKQVVATIKNIKTKDDELGYLLLWFSQRNDTEDSIEKLMSLFNSTISEYDVDSIKFLDNLKSAYDKQRWNNMAKDTFNFSGMDKKSDPKKETPEEFFAKNAGNMKDFTLKSWNWENPFNEHNPTEKVKSSVVENTSEIVEEEWPEKKEVQETVTYDKSELIASMKTNDASKVNEILQRGTKFTIGDEITEERKKDWIKARIQQAKDRYNNLLWFKKSLIEWEDVTISSYDTYEDRFTVIISLSNWNGKKTQGISKQNMKSLIEKGYFSKAVVTNTNDE